MAPIRRTATAFGARFSAEQLGRRAPRVTFCKRSIATDPVFGAATPGDAHEIFAADGLPIRESVAIGAEEAHHALTTGGDEIAAKAFGRAAAQAWTAERYRQREQLDEAYWALATRLYGIGSLAWERKSRSTTDNLLWYGGYLGRLAAWYGAGDIELGLRIGEPDLELRAAELTDLWNAVPVNPRALYDLPRQQPRRAEYSFDRQSAMEAKYAAGIGIWEAASTASESAYNRWDGFASRLYQLLVILNNGVTTARIDDAGWWDRLVATYGDRLGPNAGSTLTPSYSRQACINFGVTDLWSRWGECAKLEEQLGTQLQTFRSARGALATPTTAEMLRLMPPKIAPVQRGET